MDWSLCHWYVCTVIHSVFHFSSHQTVTYYDVPLAIGQRYRDKLASGSTVVSRISGVTAYNVDCSPANAAFSNSSLSS